VVKIGTKYPYGPTPVYPPKDWSCPNPKCRKYHSKPHYAYTGQIDFTKQPSESGRVKFNREGSQMSCESNNKYDTPYIEMKESTGPDTKVNGGHTPLFCPHCGWIEEIINIIKVKS
jgi:hypothetical protein